MHSYRRGAPEEPGCIVVVDPLDDGDRSLWASAHGGLRGRSMVTGVLHVSDVNVIIAIDDPFGFVLTSAGGAGWKDLDVFQEAD